VADAKQIEMLQADNAQLREQIAELRAELAKKMDKVDGAGAVPSSDPNVAKLLTEIERLNGAIGGNATLIRELTNRNEELSDKNAALERSMTALTAENVSLRQDFARLEERFGFFQQAQANVPTAAAPPVPVAPPLAAPVHETLTRERRSNSAPSFFAPVATVPIPPVLMIVAEEKNTPNALTAL
jgi:hypothetical protein